MRNTDEVGEMKVGGEKWSGRGYKRIGRLVGVGGGWWELVGAIENRPSIGGGSYDGGSIGWEKGMISND